MPNAHIYSRKKRRKKKERKVEYKVFYSILIRRKLNQEPGQVIFCSSVLSRQSRMADFSSSTENRSLTTPCAACKFLRRRCFDNCLLKPYFPPSEPLKFIVAHKIFGASNIIKLLQELPATQRADAVNSLVYEANARMRDPIYGSAGVITNLHDQMTKLQAQIALAQAEISNLQSQNANLMNLINKQHSSSSSPDYHYPFQDSTLLPYDDDNSNYLGDTTWDSFWS